MSRPPCQFLSVPVGDGAVMFISNPVADPHLNWSLRYVPEQKNLSAATVLSAFDYLLSSDISMKEATRRLRIMRQAQRDALLGETK